MVKTLNQLGLIENLSKDEIQLSISYQIAEQILEIGQDVKPVFIGQLSQNYFSYTFPLTFKTSQGMRHLFVKIPKVENEKKLSGILPISSRDREMANAEEASLKYLAKTWRSEDLEIFWVKMLGTIPEFNAIVTERIQADEALAVFRQSDFCARFGYSIGRKRLNDLMENFGRALHRFHAKGSKKTYFYLNSELPKLTSYCQELAMVSGSALPAQIMDELKNIEKVRLKSSEVPTLKGIDIRNFLITRARQIYLLDPGKIKYSNPEADLARFVMTYRIIFWGSPMFLLTRAAGRTSEEAFLNGYYSNTKRSHKGIFHLYLLKEQLKHWMTAIKSLEQRPWPACIKKMVNWIYVKPFYSKQIAAQYALLKTTLK